MRVQDAALAAMPALPQDAILTLPRSDGSRAQVDLSFVLSYGGGPADFPLSSALTKEAS